ATTCWATMASLKCELCTRRCGRAVTWARSLALSPANGATTRSRAAPASISSRGTPSTSTWGQSRAADASPGSVTLLSSSPSGGVSALAASPGALCVHRTFIAIRGWYRALRRARGGDADEHARGRAPCIVGRDEDDRGDARRP